MKNTKDLRHLCIIFVLLLTVTTLASCNKDSEHGKIEEVEVTELSESETALAKEYGDVFQKMDDPAGGKYTYKKYDIPSANISLDIPSKWIAVPLSPGYLRFDLPENDPLLPGASLYIKFKLDTTAYSDLDGAPNASSFKKLFEEDTQSFEWPYTDSSTLVVSKLDATEKNGGAKETAISDSEYAPIFLKKAGYASMISYDNTSVKYSSKGGHLSNLKSDKMCLTQGFFAWANIPVTIATLVTPEQESDAKSIIEYIISSSTFCAQKIPSSKNIAIGNISVSLPEDFEPESENPNILHTSSRDHLATSGMSFAVFPLEESEEMLNKDYLQQSKLYEMTVSLLDPKWRGITKVQNPWLQDWYGEQIPGAVQSYTSSALLSTDTAHDENYDNDYAPASGVYGYSAVALSDFHVVESDGDLYMLAFMYQTNQYDIIRKIEKTAIASFSTK